MVDPDVGRVVAIVNPLVDVLAGDESGRVLVFVGEARGIYWAALNVLDAELLFSSLKMRDVLRPGESAPRSVERHHLFPKAHLNARGITETRQVNAIANMAFLDWPDNSDIGADDPMEYWPAMSSRLNLDQLQLRQQCESTLSPMAEQTCASSQPQPRPSRYSPRQLREEDHLLSSGYESATPPSSFTATTWWSTNPTTGVSPEWGRLPNPPC